MKTWIAIVFAIGLWVLCIAVSIVIHVNLIPLMVVCTSVWAAVDSSKIGLVKYKSGISYGPVVLFIGCAMLWVIGFPWYVSMRYKIKTGTAVLKDEPARATA